jgi:hypothetical protein
MRKAIAAALAAVDGRRRYGRWSGWLTQTSTSMLSPRATLIAAAISASAQALAGLASACA